MLAFWSKSDMVRINKNFTLAPNVKMVKPKSVKNGLKINLQHTIFWMNGVQNSA